MCIKHKCISLTDFKILKELSFDIKLSVVKLFSVFQTVIFVKQEARKLFSQGSEHTFSVQTNDFISV